MISRRTQILLVILVTLLIVGMALYGLKLKRKAESVQQVTETRPDAPAAAANGSVTVFQANDNSGTLQAVPLNIAESGDGAERLKAILQALTNSYTVKGSAHPLAAGAGIHAVYLLKDNTAIVDLNSAFADGHPSGITCEQLTIFSMVETMVANQPDLLRVRFLVDGKPRATLAGHAALAEPYETAAVTEAVKDMQ